MHFHEFLEVFISQWGHDSTLWLAEQHTAEILRPQDPRTSWTKAADGQDGCLSLWKEGCVQDLYSSPDRYHLTSNTHWSLLFTFFSKDSNFHCLSTVPLVKNIIHNVWSEETSSGACSLWLKWSFPLVTGCPRFEPCAPSETEEETTQY